MIKITLITVGKLREKYFADMQNEYLKRLSAFSKFELIEIQPTSLPDNPNEAEIKLVLQTEAEKILKKIPSNSFVCPLMVEGKEITSEAFAEKINALQLSGTSHLCFIIGGSYGLSDALKQKADFGLSFSKMTFPHRLFRIMLLEQIYRAFKILQGSTYHK